MMGNKMSLDPAIFQHDENVAIAYGMGITGEKVAQRWQVSREAQDEFAVASHAKALKAIADRGIQAGNRTLYGGGEAPRSGHP